MRAQVRRARERLRRPSGRYVWESDGLATVHYSPFLHDADFNRSYARVADRFYTVPLDIRWRAWVLTRCARQCRTVPGAYGEFGVYRGGYTFLAFSTGSVPVDRPFYLFDTFAGIPDSALSDHEKETGFAGRLADTSVAEVAELLAPWDAQVRIVEGDVFETLPATETGPLAFAHIDLNAAAPTRHALEYAYQRAVPRAVMLFDDYGWEGCEEQRTVIDAFFADRPEEVVALPTGQALVTRL